MKEKNVTFILKWTVIYRSHRNLSTKRALKKNWKLMFVSGLRHTQCNKQKENVVEMSKENLSRLKGKREREIATKQYLLSCKIFKCNHVFYKMEIYILFLTVCVCRPYFICVRYTYSMRSHATCLPCTHRL